MIAFIQTEEGRALPNGPTAYNYEYTLTDHLGNSRVNFDTGTGTARQVQADDYYPLGMDIVIGTRPSVKNNYLYNKKELQENLGLYDYKARFYDPLTARFNSVDKLAASYPYKSPYDYAENRPINGVDLDGLEWVSTIDGQGNTHVSVNTNFSFDVDPKILPAGTTVNDYKTAISANFNTVLRNSSNGTFSGSVTFNGGNEKQLGQVVPSLSIYTNKTPEGAKISIGGGTSFQYAGVNIYKTNGMVKTPTELAEDASHELFHTVRVGHSFEQTQAEDTKLVNNGINSYLTTPKTDKNILYNIMNYNMISIDGNKLRTLWQTQRPAYLTPGQLNFILKEIDLQKQGYGTQRADYNNYWLNFPGTDVTK